MHPVSILVALLTAAALARAQFPGNPTYEEALAYDGVYYSNAVKCDPATVLDWSCGPACTNAPGLTHVTMVYNDTWQVRAFAGLDVANSRVVLSFRGTITALNWAEDADVVLMPWPGLWSGQGLPRRSPEPFCTTNGPCKVHQGFFDTYNFMAQTLLPAAEALIDNFRPSKVLITGHSLGGAQSQYAFLDMMSMFSTRVSEIVAYSYGTPRSGNDAFAAYGSWVAGSSMTAPRRAVFRVVHDEDPVPMLPLPSMGYRHFPRDFIWYNASLPPPGYVLCNATGAQAPRGAPCGGSFWHMRPSDHVTYLNVSMQCQL